MLSHYAHFKLLEAPPEIKYMSENDSNFKFGPHPEYESIPMQFKEG